MPLKLIPPGKRGSRFYYARGTINGERFTASLNTTDKAKAEKRKAELELRLINDDGGDDVTFAYAAEAYSAWRNPKHPDATNIPRLVAVLGNKLVREITQHDLVRAADIIAPNKAPATRNRAVIRPAASILHYAATNKWCDWLRVKTFREPTPKTRFVTDTHEEWLLQAVENEPQKRLLLLWLFRQGDRISDTLRTKFEDCDLSERTILRHISKTDRTVTLPLDDEICAMLAAMNPDGERKGRIFRWQTHHGADRWIKRLCDRLGIIFTPHMARHTLGKRLSDAGVSLRVIMDALGHKDSKSSLRYQRGNVESIRDAKKLVQKKGE